jgi:hypothetical protein
VPGFFVLRLVREEPRKMFREACVFSGSLRDPRDSDDVTDRPTGGQHAVYTPRGAE